MKKILLGLVLCVPFIAWAVTGAVLAVQFNINCGGRLKRAADANTIEIARDELRQVVGFLESKSITNGYTSIIYKTPNEDIGFWYRNLKSSLNTLENLNKETTELEKSNLLIKLRETILDHTSNGTSVTKPPGIALYPHNTIFAIFCWLSPVSLLIGGLLIRIGLDD